MTFSAAKGVLVAGAAMIIVHSFGFQVGPADLFQMGCGVAFLSFLGGYHHHAG